VWHFLESSSLARDPATYSLLPEFYADTSGVPGLERWTTTGGFLPAVHYNATGSFQTTLSTISWPVKAVLLHPTTDRLSIVGWRSPISGFVSLNGRFSDADPGGGNGVDWFIARGSAQLAGGSFPNGGSQDFAAGATPDVLSSIAVNAGDFI